MIIYNNIKKTFGHKKVLDIRCLTFENGNIYGIKGQNGSGKSTLCKIISKILSPDDDIAYPMLEVGYMPQDSMPFDMTVKSNMELNGKDDKKIISLLKSFDLYKYIHKNAKCLSGGEKQKLALARLMMRRYDMLILDEPTSSMDNASKIRSEKMIKYYNKKYKSTILVISHEEGQLERLTNHILYMDKGRINRHK